MGMRFRKSKKIAPGVRLNLSAKSASISIGPKGFKKTFSTSGRVTTTVGIPGTGLSYSTSTKMGQTAAGSTSQEAPAAAVVASNKNKWVTLALCVFLGFFGAHRFYVGKVGTGVLYIFTVGGLGFGWIIDMVMICCNKIVLRALWFSDDRRRRHQPHRESIRLLLMYEAQARPEL